MKIYSRLVQNQTGVIHFFPLLLIVAVVGVLSFITVSSFLPFGDNLFSNLYAKPSSYAATTSTGAGSIASLKVNSKQKYQVVAAGFKTGALQYVDQAYTFTEVPFWSPTATYIKTANADKQSKGSDFLSMTVINNVVVYVALDSRVSPVPSWLSSWSSTGERVKSSRGLIFNVYRKSFGAGLVTLGGNGGTSNSNMYTVMVMLSEVRPTPTPPASCLPPSCPPPPSRGCSYVGASCNSCGTLVCGSPTPSASPLSCDRDYGNCTNGQVCPTGTTCRPTSGIPPVLGMPLQQSCQAFQCPPRP